MGSVQNGYPYRSTFQNNKVQKASLFYCIAKSRSTNLPQNWKTKHKNFILFLLFLFFPKHNLKVILCMQILYIPNNCSTRDIFLFWFGVAYELQLPSYGLDPLGFRIHDQMFRVLNIGLGFRFIDGRTNYCSQFGQGEQILALDQK